MSTTPGHAFFRGRIMPYSEARVGLLTHGLNYGTGAFAGIRAYWNDEEEQLYVFRPGDHFRRLSDSARLLRMALPLTDEAFAEAVAALLRAEGYRADCYIRALCFYGDETIGVRLHGLQPELALVSLPFGLYIDRPEGAHLTVSSWRRVDDNSIPPRGKITGAYANSALIKSDAELAGFDEALVLDSHGRVSEGSAENVFVVRRGVVVTPSVTDSILEGITRRTVIELLRNEMGVTVEERALDRTEVYLAEEVFLTGTAVQVTAATRIDHRAIGDGQIGPIATRLRALFQDVVRGRLPKYRGWCRAVYGDKGQAALGDARPAARQRTAPSSGRASLRAWPPIPAMVRLP